MKYFNLGGFLAPGTPGSPGSPGLPGIFLKYIFINQPLIN